MNTLNKAVSLLVIMGGINWGLIGFFDYNLVEKIFSQELSEIIYCAVGIAAVYLLLNFLWEQNKVKKSKPIKD